MSENIIFKGMNAILGRLLDGPPILKTTEELRQEIEDSYVLEPSELTPVRNSLGYRVSPIYKGIHMGFGHSYISPYTNNQEQTQEIKFEYKPLTKEQRRKIISEIRKDLDDDPLINFCFVKDNDGNKFGVYIADERDYPLDYNRIPPGYTYMNPKFVWFKDILYTIEDLIEYGPLY